MPNVKFGRPTIDSEWSIGGQLVRVYAASDTHVLCRPVVGGDPKAAPLSYRLQEFLDLGLTPQAELAL